MPKWIHDRADHLRAKNPEMPKSMAFAIATQQSHALGKSPKGYGTAEGRREAKDKYRTPNDDKKTADPGGVGKKMSKEAGFAQLIHEFVRKPHEEAVRKVIREELQAPAPAQPVPAAQPQKGKSKVASVDLVVVLGFADEFLKIGTAAPAAITPFKPMTLGSMKAKANMGITPAKSIPKTTSVGNQPPPSPVAQSMGARELSQPPPVKAG